MNAPSRWTAIVKRTSVETQASSTLSLNDAVSRATRFADVCRIFTAGPISISVIEPLSEERTLLEGIAPAGVPTSIVAARLLREAGVLRSASQPITPILELFAERFAKQWTDSNR